MNEVAENTDVDQSMIDAHEDHAAMDSLRPLPRISIQAFCESDGLAQLINNCAEDRRMNRTHVRTVSGGIETACTMYASSPTPNLIILENSGTSRDLLE